MIPARTFTLCLEYSNGSIKTSCYWIGAKHIFLSGVERRVGKRRRGQNAVCLESRVRNLNFAFCLKRFNNSVED